MSWSKEKALELIRGVGLVPIVRAPSAEDALLAAEAIIGGNIGILEVTMTVPNAIRVLEKVADGFGERVLLGAGTILDPESCRAALLAGAQFIVTPSLNLQVIEMARRYSKACMPGALTPTEIVTAWEAGSDLVKVFPCSQVGGESYIKSVKTALPEIPLVAAGGVNQLTAANFILSGACAIGVGAELIPPEAIERRQGERIRELAFRFTEFVKEAREKVAAGKKRASRKKHLDIEHCEAQ